MNNPSGKVKTALLAVMLILLTTSTWAGNKKFMTVNAAKDLVERAVIESVVGLKNRATDTVENLVSTPMLIEAGTEAQIRGINYTDIVYDPTTDIAKVTAELPVARVGNIIGGNSYGNMVIKRVAFASSSPGMAPLLISLRAAELDAYRQLALRVIGFKLADGTSLEDYIFKNDSVRARVLAAIWSADLASHRWEDEDEAYMTLRLKTSVVEDALGHELDHRGQFIEVEGKSAPAQ